MHVTPRVRDYMDKSFITLSPDMDVYQAIDILLKKGITGAGVVDKKGNLLGVLSEKDCLRTLVHGAYSELPSGIVSDYMTKNVVTIAPDQDIFSTADMFFTHVFRRLLVVEEGKLIGQITRRDLLRVVQKIKLKQI
jgi:predicted transcriptional regulator